MFIVTKTAMSIFRKRKLQSILICIIMILISTLLYAGISMVNQSSPFETMFERANAAESMMIVSKENSDIESIVSWWENQKEVRKTISYESHMINGEFELEGKTETELILLTEFVKNSDVDLLYENGKTLAEAPVGNQMLINYNFAKNRNLEIGDTIKFRIENQIREFTISGYVVDPQFSTPFINPNRCFIAPDYFEGKGITNDTIVLAIKYNDIAKTDDIALFEKFNDELTEANSPMYVDYKVIQNSYNIILGVIASILLVVSILLFIIVVFVIRSTIQNLILQQYSEIGIKKVIGYTNNQIRNSIILGYGLMGLMASIAGALLGLPIRRMINEGISYDIQVGLNTAVDMFLPMTVIIIVSLILLFSYIAAKKVGKIKPVQAIKYKRPVRKGSKSKFTITEKKRTPLVVLLSIKQLFANRSKSLTTIIMISLLIYVALVIFNAGGSLTDSDHLSSYLLGLKVGDFSVADNSLISAREAEERLLGIEDVNSVIYFEYLLSDNTVASDGSSLTLTNQVIYGKSPEDLLILADGRQPNGANEIALSTDVVKETGKSTGDYINIKSGEENQTYLITGTYNSVSFDGKSYTILLEDMPDTPAAAGKLFWVYSNDRHVIIDSMSTGVLNLFDGEATVSKYDSNVKNILSTVSSFPVIINALLFIFLVVSCVIVLNTTIMDINNSNKEYGIMKSMGYSNGNITGILVIRTMIIIGIGTVFGFIANMLTMNAFMQGVFKVTPFSSIELPVVLDAAGSFAVVVLFILIGIIGTLIPAGKIRNISPKQLISE